MLAHDVWEPGCSPVSWVKKTAALLTAPPLPPFSLSTPLAGRKEERRSVHRDRDWDRDRDRDRDWDRDRDRDRDWDRDTERERERERQRQRDRDRENARELRRLVERRSCLFA